MANDNVITHELPDELKTVGLPIMRRFFRYHHLPTDVIDKFEIVIPFRNIPEDPDKTEDEITLLGKEVDGVQVLFLNTPHIFRIMTELNAAARNTIPPSVLFLVYVTTNIYNKTPGVTKKRSVSEVLTMYADFVASDRDAFAADEVYVSSFIQEEVDYLVYCLRLYDMEADATRVETPVHAEKPKPAPPKTEQKIEFTIGDPVKGGNKEI